jgi:hypothetical protein
VVIAARFWVLCPQCQRAPRRVWHRSIPVPHVKYGAPSTTTPHHTTSPSHSSSEQSLLVEFDNKATPLNRVDEDVAARESKVTPSADKLNPASSDSLREKCQSVYMLSKKKKDLGY